MLHRHLSCAVLLAASAAQASGFYFGDNGAKLMVQGGAFTAQADDLTAIQHNPAGLAQLDGFNFLADGLLLNHQVSFLRNDSGFDPAAPTTLVNAVENRGGLFVLPFFGASYGLPLLDRTLTLGLGIYGPPAVGRYTFNEPNYEKDSAGKYLESPRKYAPNRYALIANDILIYYPSVSAAYAVHPRVMLGVSLQVVMSNFKFRQATYSGVQTPRRQLDEDPYFDSVVSVDLPGRPTFTAILGALFKPTDSLSFGASLRPSIPITAQGRMEIELGDAARDWGTQAPGGQAILSLTMPLELRLGARWQPLARLGVNADFVYQGWDSLQELVLAPQDMTMTIGNGDPQPIPTFRSPKHWRATFSGRVGATFDVVKWVSVSAGAWYETTAMPDEYYNLDFANPTRIFLTGGVTGHAYGLDLIAGLAFTPSVTRVIQHSQVRQGQTDPLVQGGVVGDGLYTSGGWVLSFGVRGHFGGTKVAAPPSAPAGEGPLPAGATAP